MELLISFMFISWLFFVIVFKLVAYWIKVQVLEDELHKQTSSKERKWKL